MQKVSKKNYIAKAILEVRKEKDWGTQSKKGNYTVTMRVSDEGMECSFYYKRELIADWDSNSGEVVLYNPGFKMRVYDGIRGAGYKIMGIRESLAGNVGIRSRVKDCRV